MYMYKNIISSLYFALLMCVLQVLPVQTVYGRSVAVGKDNGNVVLAYVTSWSSVMPNPQVLTHINYAFGHVDSTFAGVKVDNPQRLEAISALKKKHPHLKVMLSVGGWGSGRFSEMAADPHLREKFAKDCRRVVRKYNLDGIDIDWEYPTVSAAGISSSENDVENFTLLMRDIRKAVGKKKLLTLATVCNAKYIDFPAIMPYVDFVNIMAYDMTMNIAKHHAPLFVSENTSELSAANSIEAHLAAGVPPHKLVLGVPFYGRGNEEFRKSASYSRMPALPEGFQEKWDEKAQSSYIANAKGEFVFGYETPRSLAVKCQYAKKKGLKGIMFWEYAGDTPDNKLCRVLREYF